MSTDDRLRRNNLMHLRDDPEALRRELEQIQARLGPELEAWHYEQRRRDREAYEEAGLAVDDDDGR